jgi:hypothetical protein
MPTDTDNQVSFKTTILTSLRQASDAKGETNDCTVTALAAAGQVSYDQAHAALSRHGRPYRKGPPAKRQTIAHPGYGVERNIVCPALEKAARELGLGFRVMSRQEWRAKTMLSVPRDPRLAKGNYICMVRGHVAAVVNGQVIDWTDGRRHQVKDVYEIIPGLPKAEPAQPAEPMRRMAGFHQGRLF